MFFEYPQKFNLKLIIIWSLKYTSHKLDGKVTLIKIKK